jgi:hypothetical protein
MTQIYLSIGTDRIDSTKHPKLHDRRPLGPDLPGLAGLVSGFKGVERSVNVRSR